MIEQVVGKSSNCFTFLDESTVVGRESGEGGIGEAAFDDSVAGFTAQPGDCEFAIANRTFSEGCLHNL